jgi:hypothetical protein
MASEDQDCSWMELPTTNDAWQCSFNKFMDDLFEGEEEGELLIDELKMLWSKDGVETWDAKYKRNFKMHAMLLWSINDFPAYAILSGWSNKGRFACPYCHMDT